MMWIDEIFSFFFPCTEFEISARSMGFLAFEGPKLSQHYDTLWGLRIFRWYGWVAEVANFITKIGAVSA